MIPYYGDNTRWFLGRVISIDDPLELGRVKVRIFGIHSESIEDIPEADLPWAQTVIPVTEGGSSGIGANVGIKEQAQVYGIFLDGKTSQLPLVLGSIPKVESKASKRTEEEKEELKGVSNIEKAYNWFLSERGGGFTPAQAAGIIGNLMKESLRNNDIDPTIPNEVEGSIGIAQWNPAPAAGNRLGKLQDFCRERGYYYKDLQPQLEFITYELYTTEGDALKRLREAKTAEQAAIAFEWYERPEGWWGPTNTPSISVDARIAYAEGILEEFEVV